jgi:DNA primase
MSQQIPQDKIEEIKSANDIVDIISSYISLIKRGRNYIARCPFHNEKTPSFSVSPDKQMYYCFGCHKGGNVFTFLQEYEKLSFIEAVKKLAEKANIPLLFHTESDEKEKELESIYYINQVTAEYFNKNLMENPAGKIGLDYLLNRGITRETIDKFLLGFSINSWDNLHNYLEQRKLNMEYIENLGLIGKKTDGGYFDTFRGRIMYPIFSISGKVAGFGGRKLFENDNSGKYINSRESRVYNKSRILYGLSHTKEEIRKNEKAILVEGYMDFLSLYQNGFKNVIATSGTALTNDQIKILIRYTKNIIFLYDADMAGVKATIRGLDLLLENNLNVNIVELIEGEDPDSFIKKFGAERFKRALDLPVSFVEFIAKVYRKTGKLNTTEGLTESVREILTLITKVRDNLKREFYIKEIAEKFNLTESVIRDEYQNLNKPRKKIPDQEKTITQPASEKKPMPEKKDVEKIILPTIEEEDLMAIIIMHGKGFWNFAYNYITMEDIQSPVTKRMIKFFNENLKEDESLTFDNILTMVDPDIAGYLSGLQFKGKIMSEETLGDDIKDIETRHLKWLKDVIKIIKIKRVEAEINRIKNMIGHYEGDEDGLNTLLNEIKELNEAKVYWTEIE